MAPLNQAVTVGAPKNVTVAARVYDAGLRVSDYLQLPISGASVTVRLANGTSLHRITGIGGTISLTSIPFGRFNATVSYLGFSQRTSMDVGAESEQLQVTLPASLPDLASTVGIALLALVVYVVVRRRGVRLSSVT